MGMFTVKFVRDLPVRPFVAALNYKNLIQFLAERAGLIRIPSGISSPLRGALHASRTLPRFVEQVPKAHALCRFLWYRGWHSEIDQATAVQLTPYPDRM
jgi:hypothetical protein